jgi:hypothetical protein
MNTFWSRAAAVVAIGVGVAGACSAQHLVPEIDAGSGAIGLTLVFGFVLWVQQIRRRGSSVFTLVRTRFDDTRVV